MRIKKKLSVNMISVIRFALDANLIRIMLVWT